MTWILAAACGAASIPAGLRWLRVAQREHYLAPSVTRFAWRWWTSGLVNLLLSLVAAVGVVGTLWSPWFGFLVAAVQVGPVGLNVRGRTSKLVWTPRLNRLAVLTLVFVVAVYLVGGFAGTPLIVVLGLLLLPVFLDMAMGLLAPIEKRLGDRWVDQAAGRLRSSSARVVAVTGSYGKTTTKGYVAHLLTGSLRAIASPASFNNRMGLARAINEQLVPGTEVFVAEMGTYGEGEIAELCEWMPPTVAAIVAIGPVHLERFKTEELIVKAKSEILDRAEAGVIAIDNPLLAKLAAERSHAMKILTAGTGETEADVTISGGRLAVNGTEVAVVPDDVFEINLAVAVAICLALRLDADLIWQRLAALPTAEHRQTVTVSENGFTVIDDTYNSNPAGAAAGLDLLARVGKEGRSVVVTPGMVELGKRQAPENAAFASRASRYVNDLVIVGETNRRALLEGASDGSASVTVVRSRQDAVDWVRANLGEGDAVLYENDLPDHYP